MGSKEAYAVLVMARCGQLDDSRRLIEAQQVTGLSIAQLREGRPCPTATASKVYSDDECLVDQRGNNGVAA